MLKKLTSKSFNKKITLKKINLSIKQQRINYYRWIALLFQERQVKQEIWEIMDLVRNEIITDCSKDFPILWKKIRKQGNDS